MTATLCANFQLLTLEEQDRLLSQIRNTLYPPQEQTPPTPTPDRLFLVPPPDQAFRSFRCSRQAN